MERRDFLKNSGLVVAGLASRNLLAYAKNPPQSKVDFILRIAPVSFDIASGKTIHTLGYNGQAPGPLLRMKEGIPVMVDVFNDTDHEEIVHWHGQMISVEADGATEEGTPAVAPHAHRRPPKPTGTRWYHSHAFAGKNLHRSLYSGQFGFVYIEPKVLQLSVQAISLLVGCAQTRSVPFTRKTPF
jgi:FtsP/CotA-like multicopper oxidase with cupredoxin domain